MLSPASFSSQAGGILSSLLCSIFIGAAGIGSVWRIAAVLGLGIAVFGAVKFFDKHTKLPAADTIGRQANI